MIVVSVFALTIKQLSRNCQDEILNYGKKIEMHPRRCRNKADVSRQRDRKAVDAPEKTRGKEAKP